MKLSTWCKKKGICYMTGYNWFKAGQIKGAYATPTGSIFVEDDPVVAIQKPTKVFIYARVSNRERKKEMEYQIGRCEDFCLARGLSVDAVYKEIASGMNDDRRELWRMLNEKPTTIVVENKDRLTRFGFNYLDRLLKRLDCEVLVINKDIVDEQDLIKDMIAVVTSFCCRLYGLRRGQNKVSRIKDIIKE